MNSTTANAELPVLLRGEPWHSVEHRLSDSFSCSFACGNSSSFCTMLLSRRVCLSPPYQLHVMQASGSQRMGSDTTVLSGSHTACPAELLPAESRGLGVAARHAVRLRKWGDVHDRAFDRSSEGCNTLLCLTARRGTHREKESVQRDEQSQGGLDNQSLLFLRADGCGIVA